jgi:hypothetical protein
MRGFDSRILGAPIVQRLEYVVANDVVRVRLPVGAEGCGFNTHRERAVGSTPIERERERLGQGPIERGPWVRVP